MTKPPPLSRIRNASDFASYLFHFCGSLRLTVVLMLYIAVACVFGTFFEGRHGTKAAQAAIYKSWWFDIGLGLMATNITCSTLRRWPFQRKHTGFIITHIGILVVLFGAFMTHRYGIEGQVAILEGESEARLFRDENILMVSDRPDDEGTTFSTDFEDRPWEHAPKTSFEAPTLGAQVTVDEYYPNAVFSESLADDGPAENPAVTIALSGGRMTGNAVVSHTLLARDPKRRAIDFGMMTLSLEEAETADAVQAQMPAVDGATVSLGALRLSGEGLGLPPDLEVPLEEGRRVDLGESGLFFRVVKYYSWFNVGKDKRPTNVSPEPGNPAIEYEIGRGEEVVDRNFKFLRHDIVIKENQIPLVLEWHAPELAAAAERTGGTAPAEKSLRLFSLPSGEIRYISTVSSPSTTGVLRLGDSIELSAKVGLAAQLVACARRGRLVEEVRNDGNEVKRSAVRVRVRRGDAEVTTWIANQEVSPLRVGTGGPLYVGYGSRSLPLPFTIHLVDFKEEQYPRGSNQVGMSSAFSSRILLEDTEKGVFREHVISMNNVLDWRGYRFFQSSFQRPPNAAPDAARETSIFAVNKDPGKPIVYLGFIVLCSGIVTLFYIQPALRKRRTIRPASRSVPPPSLPVPSVPELTS